MRYKLFVDCTRCRGVANIRHNVFSSCQQLITTVTVLQQIALLDDISYSFNMIRPFLFLCRVGRARLINSLLFCFEQRQ